MGALPRPPCIAVDSYLNTYKDYLCRGIFLPHRGLEGWPNTVAPRLAGGEWPGRCDFVRDERAVYRLPFPYRTGCPGCSMMEFPTACCIYSPHVMEVYFIQFTSIHLHTVCSAREPTPYKQHSYTYGNVRIHTKLLFGTHYSQGPYSVHTYIQYARKKMTGL